jgi:hypothetical protein
VPAFDRGRFAAVIPVPGAASMTVAEGMLFVLASGTVVRIDPETNAVVGEPLPVPADTEAIAVGDRALWVAVVAMVDRLVHHAEIIALKGDSYRLKGRGKEVTATTEGS